MKSRVVSSVSAVVDSLRGGHVVAYPTEAVFGLGCDPANAVAVAAIHRLKGRRAAQGFLLVASEFTQVAAFVDLRQVDDSMRDKAMASWPGPVTWIFPASDAAPAWVMGEHCGIAIRVSAHPSVRLLCAAFGGAIVSTSANPHGSPPAKTARQTLDYFPEGLAAIWDSPVGEASKPTPIHDVLTGRMLRG